MHICMYMYCVCIIGKSNTLDQEIFVLKIIGAKNFQSVLFFVG